MQRPVTEEDLIADPSLSTIGVKVGDLYDFEVPDSADETLVPKFDPFTGKPLTEVEEPAKAEADESAEKPVNESDIIDEPAGDVVDSNDPKEDVAESEPVKEPVTYADILERGINLNKIEAANLHPGISQIAQWGDMEIRQIFKPEN